MNGLVLRDVPIAVDYWRPTKCRHVKYFFLSHIHSDHTEGLTSSWQSKIYCSEITRALAIEKFNIKPDHIIGLEIGQVKSLPLCETSEENISVTLIDANHIPGAVMFLFEGYFGTILYTGDFRYTSSMFDSVLGTKHIDDLYLDNTYCEPACVFPSREEATKQILRIIEQHPEHRVVIGLSNYGREELLVKIAQTLKEWIIVTRQRYDIMKLLGMPNVFSISQKDGRILVVDRFTVSKKSMEYWNTQCDTIAIVPTSLYSSFHNPYQGMQDVFVIQYSDHCSYPELCTFVQRVHPKAVYPVVKTHKGFSKNEVNTRVDMSVFDKYLDLTPRKSFVIPEQVCGEGILGAKNSKKVGKSRVSAPKKIKPQKIVFNTPEKPKVLHHSSASKTPSAQE